MRINKSKLGRVLSSGYLAAVAVALLSCATPSRSAMGEPLRSAAGGYEVEVLVDGSVAPTFSHAGESYVLGQRGERYTLRVWNRSARRVEAVVSVDGRDVVDGHAGDFRSKRGYLVAAWGFVDIDGWRLSEHQAAAFRFTTVADSYAARVGHARNVGVIGVAVFPERVYPRPRLVYPRSPMADDELRRESAPMDKGAAVSQDAADALAEAEGGATGALRGAAPTAAPAPAMREKAERSSAARRPGLGTEFGEAVASDIQGVEFVRANPANPIAILGARYNNRAGLLALGIDVDGRFHAYDDLSLRGSADPFPVSHRYAAPPSGWQR